ncbi:single-stranded DNA-binding protein [Actinoplanes sp. NPDC049596]|uniref:single-stranded DNA-binding protein n=1 Tax=unclassified Actinoplanes TaxID=2626549 RepID=UPI0034157C01
MFDTNLVVVGNVLAAPEWRRVSTNGNLVANFRIASNSRRFDRETNAWVDGHSLRIRVSAWRKLAEGVASSITVGDPVIVYGRLYSRDWKDEQGNNRISYDMVAYSIGHDLGRGRARFFRQKALPGGSAIEDAEADLLVGGEPSIPVTAEEVPAGYGEGIPETDTPEFAEPPVFPEVPAELSPVAAVAEKPATEETADDDFTLEVERLTNEQPATPARRGRRSSAKREPIAA